MNRFINAQEIAAAINTANATCDAIAKVLDAKTVEDQKRLLCAAEVAASNLHALLRKTRIACHAKDEEARNLWIKKAFADYAKTQPEH